MLKSRRCQIWKGSAKGQVWLDECKWQILENRFPLRLNSTSALLSSNSLLQITRRKTRKILVGQQQAFYDCIHYVAPFSRLVFVLKCKLTVGWCDGQKKLEQGAQPTVDSQWRQQLATSSSFGQNMFWQHQWRGSRPIHKQGLLLEVETHPLIWTNPLYFFHI